MNTDRKIRVLVTGATGFLGSNILKAVAAQRGLEPVAACRRPENLPANFSGKIRAGDMLDPGYRRRVVKNIDVICHAGTWAALWGHRDLERERFYAPTRDLMENAIAHGVRRFIMASTVAISAPAGDGQRIDDFSPTRRTGFWPHLDYLIDIDHAMRANRHHGTQMVTLRLGHFIGAGNRLGLVPALVPRLKTRLVPWLAGGKKRLPLVAGSDLGQAFALAALAGTLDDYESFNICGAEFPTLREVVEYIARVANCPMPLYSVPYPAGYRFGWLMEMLKPVLPGTSPFLTRSVVHLCENWLCATDYARNKLGYSPAQDWRSAVREHLAALAIDGYPWPQLRGA